MLGFHSLADVASSHIGYNIGLHVLPPESLSKITIHFSATRMNGIPRVVPLIRWILEFDNLVEHIVDSSTTRCLVHRSYNFGLFLLAKGS